MGLKGSDGREIAEKAFSLGAVKEAPLKATKTLERLTILKNSIIFYTYPGEMGENNAAELGFTFAVLGKLTGKHSTAEDTRKAAEMMIAEPVELIIFAGGDGTARDIYDVAGNRVPVIGIPAGVKIHSAVYASTPAGAGDTARLFLAENSRVELKEAEVMDIDEDAFRNNRLSARLYGYMKVPNIRALMQNAKAGSTITEKEAINSIAASIAAKMNHDTCYIIGPGTTTGAIMDCLSLKNTLLGVDIVYNKRLIKSDASENDILTVLDKMEKRQAGVKIITTVIGGQGYIFGRGNQQISYRVIRRVGKDNLIIVAAENKMIALKGNPLLVDTGSSEVDKMLSGYVRVITAPGREMAYRVSF